MDELVQKNISKKHAAEKKRKYKLEGNMNNILNPLEVPDTFEFEKREIKDIVVRDAGTKDALYNSEFMTDPRGKNLKQVIKKSYIL